jgi:hypothetical protein
MGHANEDETDKYAALWKKAIRVTRQQALDGEADPHNRRPYRLLGRTLTVRRAVVQTQAEEYGVWKRLRRPRLSSR